MIGRTLVWGAVALAVMPGSALAKAGDPIKDSYICTFLPGPISTGAEARQAVGAVGGRVTHVYSHVLSGFSAHMSSTAVQKLLAKNPLIKSCSQDRVAAIPPTVVSGITGRPGGGGGGGSTQTLPWGVKRVGGGVNYAGSAVAWIIDTGIDLTHPDLNVAASRSISYIAAEPSPNDGNGHGTHVAGIIGARNNSFGVVGVAANATLIALKVLDSTGNGDDSGVVAAIDYAVANGAAGDVINLSLITGPMAEMDQAVAAAGAAGFSVAIAAGNDSANAINYSPARADGTGVYTVSATDSKDAYARYSNWGNPPIDFAEPGSSILSTYKNGAYATLSGTSMAAPHLAGVLLLHGGSPPRASGTALRDPDGHPDPIGVN